ncbi:hypothetical protein HDU67_005543 [Dinochytrium kinnereticum]|nr:hypothetical protein HDU67_005543 [Dinochytrium kinnereticum]
MITSHELLNLRSLSYALIARFLHDQGHHQTLETFRAEAVEAFEDVEGRVLPFVDEGTPLLGILEEYLVGELRKSAKIGTTVDDKEFDEVLGRPSDGTVKLPTLTQTYEGIHHANILSVSSTTLPTREDAPPTQVLLTTSTDKSLRVSTLTDGQCINIISCPTNSPFLSTSIHPTMPHIVLASCMDGSHHLLDVNPDSDLSVTGSIVQSWKDHTKYVVRAAFSPDGGVFVTGSHDRNVKVYEKREGGLVPQYDHVHTVNVGTAVEALTIVTLTDETGSTPAVIFSCRDDNLLHIITLPTFTHTLHNMNPNNDTWVSFTALDLSPSPTNLHLAIHTDSTSGRIILARMPSRSAAMTPDAGVTPLVHVRSFYGGVVDGFSRPRCGWDAGGRWVVGTSDDGVLMVFEAASGRVVGKLEGHRGMVRGLVTVGGLEEGWKWVTCSFDKTVRVWG